MWESYSHLMLLFTGWACLSWSVVKVQGHPPKGGRQVLHNEVHVCVMAMHQQGSMLMSLVHVTTKNYADVLLALGSLYRIPC